MATPDQVHGPGEATPRPTPWQDSARSRITYVQGAAAARNPGAGADPRGFGARMGQGRATATAQAEATQAAAWHGETAGRRRAAQATLAKRSREVAGARAEARADAAHYAEQADKAINTRQYRQARSTGARLARKHKVTIAQGEAARATARENSASAFEAHLSAGDAKRSTTAAAKILTAATLADKSGTARQVKAVGPHAAATAKRWDRQRAASVREGQARADAQDRAAGAHHAAVRAATAKQWGEEARSIRADYGKASAAREQAATQARRAAGNRAGAVAAFASATARGVALGLQPATPAPRLRTTG